MKKKTTSILLGVFLAASMVTGCGKANEATEAANESVQTEKEGTGEVAEGETAQTDSKSKKTEETDKAEQKDDTKAGSESEDSAGDTHGDTSEEEQKEKIAVLLPDEDSWSVDGEELEAKLTDDGYEPVIMYAEGDVSKQVMQIQDMTEEAVSAFVIAPVDAYGLKDVLADVKEAEIPVVSYDELIMDTNAVRYYVTFGGRQIGQMVAKEIIDKEELDKVQEDKESRSIEFLMGSQDNTQALFFYNGLMETLQPYLDDGTLVCKSGKISFDNSGILRWSSSQAKTRMSEILEEYYPDGDSPDIICTGFDGAALSVIDALEEAGIVSGTEKWPLITGSGCEADAVKRIAEGKLAFSVFTDRRELADQCEDMVNVYLHGDDDPEVNDYEQYDNGVKIIATYLCEPQLIDQDNYEILIDNGYYTAREVRPEATPTPIPEEISPTPVPEEISQTPAPEEISPTPASGEISATPVPEETSPTPTPEEISPTPTEKAATPSPSVTKKTTPSPTAKVRKS